MTYPKVRRKWPRAKRLDVELSEPLQKMLRRNGKVCRDCGSPVALVDVLMEDGAKKVQLIDPFPVRGGWVWLPMYPKHRSSRGALRRFPPFPDDALPFRRHSCAAPGNEKESER